MGEAIVEKERVSVPAGLMGDVQRIKETIGEAQQIVAWRRPVYTGFKNERKDVLKITIGYSLPDEFRFSLGEYLPPGIEIKKQEVDYLYTTPTLLFSLMRSGELESFRTNLVIPGDQRVIDLEPLKKTMTGGGGEDVDHLNSAHIINEWLRAEAISAALRIGDTLRQEKGDLHLTDGAKKKLKEELELSEEPSEEQIIEAEEQRKKLLAKAVFQIMEQDEIRLSLRNLIGEKLESKEDQRLRESLSQEFLVREKEKPGQTAIDWFKQERRRERLVIYDKLESCGLSLRLLKELEGKSMDEVKKKVEEATKAYEKEGEETVSLKDFLDGEEKVTRVLDRIIDSLETFSLKLPKPTRR